MINLIVTKNGKVVKVVETGEKPEEVFEEYVDSNEGEIVIELESKFADQLRKILAKKAVYVASVFRASKEVECEKPDDVLGSAKTAVFFNREEALKWTDDKIKEIEKEGYIPAVSVQILENRGGHYE